MSLDPPPATTPSKSSTLTPVLFPMKSSKQMYRDRVSSDDRLAATWTLSSAIPSQSGETTPCFGYPLLYKSFAHPHCLQWLRFESRNTRNSLTLTPHSSLSLSLIP